MGESYDSIGSRVIRHFRHYINGSRHIWLKGDYIDPTLPHKTHIPEQETTVIPVHPGEKEVPVSPVQETMQVEDEESIGLEKQTEKLSGHEENIQEVSNVDQALDKDSQVQKDFIKVDLSVKADKIKESIKALVTEEKIEFKFTKGEGLVGEQDGIKVEDVDHDKGDETDKILCKEDEIIDIRPIIAANRKRHASNTGGVEPEEGIARTNSGPLLKKKKSALKGDSNVLETISDHMNGTCNLGKIGLETFSTVLNQRSVYYRSQVKMDRDTPS